MCTSSNIVHVSGVVSGSASVLNRPHPADVFRWIRSRERSPGGGHGWRDSTSARTHRNDSPPENTHTHTKRRHRESEWTETQRTQEQQMLFSHKLLINAKANWRSICLQTEDSTVFHSHDRLKQTEEDRRRNSLMEEHAHFPFYATWIQFLSFLLIYNTHCCYLWAILNIMHPLFFLLLSILVSLLCFLFDIPWRGRRTFALLFLSI